MTQAIGWPCYNFRDGDLNENNIIELLQVFSTIHTIWYDLNGFPHLVGLDIAESDADVGFM